MKNKIIIICGPTGIGKTGFAIDLARRFNGEIIGADSMQIYKYMDIGTAKPDPEERRMAPHHLIDFLEPDQEYDAGKYMNHADVVIDNLHKNMKLPIVAGGTGFYIKALLHGLFREHTVNPNVIERLEKECLEKGPQPLHERLALMDPPSAVRIHPNDSFRVIRALEVLEVTGKTISSFQNCHGFQSLRYTALKIGLHMERSLLYERIEKRVDNMIEQGLVDEVLSLVQRGYSCNLKSMGSIGYRHICDHINNGVPWDQTLEFLKRDTRRYAKRQLTWFRSESDIIRLEPEEICKAGEMIR
ncbi:MAG: tRNA (adenosine(37)-N6)-dimethylallyltransferase MiaA, partial [Desulfamplus sp.]|nr:tRNA (adenosine(37)-N6)-dimethylallyltransferase MiaA [Desulfamplus sp.]